MRRPSVLVLAVMGLLLVSACGARLSPDQVAATRGGATASRPASGPAARAGGPAAATATTAPVAAAGPAAAGPTVAAGPAVAASPTAADPSADASCSPTGGALDVGIDDSHVTVASVATVSGPVPGLFENVQKGIRAYAAYINSQGGICGRRLDVLLADDRLDAGTNRSQTQALVDKAFAFVGSYSVVDDGGAAVLAGSGIPDIGSSIGAKRASMPENFATSPTDPSGQHNGSQNALKYFMAQYGVSRAAVVWPAQADARARGQAYVNDMKDVGLPVVDTFEVAVTETNYTGVATKMQNDNVDFVITALDFGGIAKLAMALDQIGYHPKVPFYGQQAYGSKLIDTAGKAADGTILALGHDIVEDAANNPAMASFAEWYTRANPGADMDFFAVQGWIAGAMFTDAMKQAGPSPTRAKALAALQTFTHYEASGLIAPIDPAERKPTSCFVVVTVEGGQWKRVDPAQGFRC